MKHSQWLEVGARVGQLWPAQTWPPETMASTYDLFAKLELEPVIGAVNELASGGREFAPAPGVVLARALQIVIASTPALPDVDLIRDLTPEERERARLMAAALNGDRSRLVQATWIEFTHHSRLGANLGESPQATAERIKACDGRCGVVANRCRQSSQTSRQIDPWIDDVCADGRALFTAWREACFELYVAVFGSVQAEAAL